MPARIETINEELKLYKFIDGEDENGDGIHPNLRRKLIPQDMLPALRSIFSVTDRKIVFTTGAYDMIHVGHARYLDRARSLGDALVVGLNSDLSVRAYKGEGRPILQEVRRAEMLADLESVTYIVLYDEPTAEGVIRLLKPDKYLCVVGSWEEGTELKDKPEVAAMIEYGGEIYLSPRQDPTLSTSVLVDYLQRLGKAEALRELAALVNAKHAEIAIKPTI